MVYRLLGKSPERILGKAKAHGINIQPFRNVPVISFEFHTERIGGERCVYFCDEGDGVWAKVNYNKHAPEGRKWVATRLNVVPHDKNLPFPTMHIRELEYGLTNSFRRFVEEMPVFIYACETDSDVADMLGNIAIDMKTAAAKRGAENDS